MILLSRLMAAVLTAALGAAVLFGMERFVVASCTSGSCVITARFLQLALLGVVMLYPALSLALGADTRRAALRVLIAAIVTMTIGLVGAVITATAIASPASPPTVGLCPAEQAASDPCGVDSPITKALQALAENGGERLTCARPSLQVNQGLSGRIELIGGGVRDLPKGSEAPILALGSLSRNRTRRTFVRLGCDIGVISRTRGCTRGTRC